LESIFYYRNGWLFLDIIFLIHSFFNYFLTSIKYWFNLINSNLNAIYHLFNKLLFDYNLILILK
jgi:hypothetical protein